MSIVGPRPERPFFVEQFKHRIPQYMLRHKVKAGITGWAQVNGWRGNTSLEKRIEYDLYYIENWSVSLDLKIMWMTLVRGVFPHRHRAPDRRTARAAALRDVQASVVITGAAGFIGSHLAEALLDRGFAVVGIDNLLTGDLANIAHLREPRLRVHQARRHQLHLRRRAGRLRAALGQPGQPDRLPGAADPDAEGRRARHAQGARPGQGQGRDVPASPRPPRSTATRWSIRRRRPTGATSTRSARAACTTRPSASPRR